ncbi:hypothetical protein [Streptomyces lavendulae]|uniref:hypothetical protein n=1 Tax=Streptomyces lavendulae TaxID=1914 RepID=UPI0036BA075B
MLLSVWVASRTVVNGGWRTCDQLGPLMSEEMIRTCDEIRAVVGAQSRFVARVLSAPQAPIYRGFRLVGRRKDTGELVGLAEWTRSLETGEFVANADVFSACPWEHKEDQLIAA